MVQYSSDMKKVGEVRLKTTEKRRALTTTIERASYFTLTKEFASMVAADYPVGTVLVNCVFVGGYWEQDGDEGADGTITVEKWDDITGSGYQTAISDAMDMDAGAASMEEITAVATGDEEVAAGEKIIQFRAGQAQRSGQAQ